jgi:hypothetical protein
LRFEQGNEVFFQFRDTDYLDFAEKVPNSKRGKLQIERGVVLLR